MLLVREKAPLRLDVDIATPDNHHARWGMDERSPANVPGGLTFSSTMPGGYEAMSCVLERQPERDYSDLAELSTITVRGAGGQIAWQGRLERTPRVSGDQLSVSPAAVGWQAHLDDDASAAMIYIDRELSRWGAASVQRQINLVGASLGLNVFSFQAQPDQSSGAPSLMFTAPGGWTGKQLTEAWYDASHVGGIGRVRWQNDLFIAIAGNDPNVLLGVFACTDDVASAFIGSNLDLTPNGPGDFGIAPVFAPGQYRFALLQAGYGISGGSPDGTFGYAFQNLAVIGTHGLSIHPGPSGISPGIDDGVLASEVIAHAIGRWAPKLSFSTGPDGTIRPSTFVIPHLAFTEPGTVSQIVKAATAFGLPDWAVWDGPTFYCADRGTFAKSWRARVYPARLQETGPQVDRLWNGVIVSYCVDPDTECLTKRGWSRYDQLQPSDELLAFDPKTRTTRWEVPREIFVNENYVGDMVLLSGTHNNQLGAFTTPDHRWPIYKRPRNGRPPTVKVLTSETLGREGHLIRRAPYADAPQARVLSDELVRLVAWHMTEGSLGADGQRITISQSLTANPDYVAAIRADLQSIGKPGGRKPARLLCQWCNKEPLKRSGRSFCSYSCATTARHAGFKAQRGTRRRRTGLRYCEYTYSKGKGSMTMFRISGEGVDEIIRAAPGKAKVPTMEFLLSLTTQQLEIFIETCLKGDGTPKKRIFYQHHPGRMEAFTAAAVLAGKCPTLHAKGAACSLNEVKLGTDLSELERTRMAYAGTVWCPVTESGHWVARRRGKVFITGNTDVTGITRTVGPPGSGADVEDGTLLDADPLNPVNEAGIRRYTPLQMGTSTSAGAIKVGATFLQASKELNSSGQASLVGHVEDDHGVLWPAWKVRAGDEISFVDAHDPSPRRVVQAAWDDSSKTMTVQLDAPPQGLEWLLARLGAVVQPLGF